MSITKQKIVDRIETLILPTHNVIQVRDAIQIIESGEVISETYHRYQLHPDSDVSKISDPVVLAQFKAVMTDKIKANYQTLLKKQKAENNRE
jgi:hypothetical protein